MKALATSSTWRNGKRLLDLDAPEERGLFGGSVAVVEIRRIPMGASGRGRARVSAKLAAAIRNSPLDPARVAYVAGVAEETACDIVVDEAAPTGPQSEGDGVGAAATAACSGRRAFPKASARSTWTPCTGIWRNDRRHFDAIPWIS